MKRQAGLLLGAVFTIMMTVPAFAGQWVLDDTGWWYDNGDGTWPANTWEWIDGNGDGIAECYYFYEDGYMASGAVVGDASQGIYVGEVNEDGALVEEGVVQTKVVVDDTGALARYDSENGQTVIIKSGDPLIITFNGYSEEGWFESTYEAEWVEEGIRARVDLGNSYYRDFVIASDGLTIETYHEGYGYAGTFQDGWYALTAVS